MLLYSVQRGRRKKLNSTVRGSGGSLDGLKNFASSYHQAFQIDVHRTSYCNRLFVPDAQSGRKFLVDTGANVSIIPYCTIHKNIQNANRYTLFAANGTKIKTYGTIRLTLDLGHVVLTLGTSLLLIPLLQSLDPIFYTLQPSCQHQGG